MDPDSTPGNDSTTEDDDDTESTTPTPVADVSVDKTDFDATAVAGQEFTYQLTVSNGGSSDATGIMVTDTLPDGMTLVSADPGFGPFDIAYGDPDLVITVTVLVDASVDDGAILTNNVTDPNPGNNEDSEDTPVGRSADLVITKWPDSQDVEIGGTATFTIHVENLGPSDADSVVVSDEQASGCEQTFLSIAAGAYEEYTCTQTVTQDVGDFTNVAEVKSDDPDPDMSNNSDDAFVNALPIIEVIKKVDGDGDGIFGDIEPIPEGTAKTVTFEMSITNQSAVTDPVTVTLLQDTLHSQEIADQGIQITGWIQPGMTGTFTFTAIMSGPGEAPNAGYSESDEVTITVADDEGAATEDSDKATVNVVNVNPTIMVTKEVDANGDGVFNDIVESISEITSTEVTFKVTIESKSVTTDPVTITTVTDQIVFDTNGNGVYGDTFNDVADQVITINITDPNDPNLVSTTFDSSLVGTVLQPGDSVSGTFSVNFPAGINPWEDPKNTVTVTGKDDEDIEATDSDDAKVDILIKNQRSIQVTQNAWTYDFAGESTVSILKGSFNVLNVSNNQPNDVLISNVNIALEIRKNNKGKFTPLTFDSAAKSTFTPALPFVIAAPEVDQDFTFTCDVSGLGIANRDVLKVTAEVNVFESHTNFTSSYT